MVAGFSMSYRPPVQLDRSFCLVLGERMKKSWPRLRQMYGLIRKRKGQEDSVQNA